MNNRKVAVSGLIVAVMLIVMASVAIMPVQASTELQITDDNWWSLLWIQEGEYSNGKLLWVWYGYGLDATYERNWYGYIQHADNYGNYWGECVSSCKALSNDNTGTWNWDKGRRIVNGGVPSGTVIATFFGSGGTYSGHSAILKAYIRNGGGSIIGFEVWDQNWYQVNGMGVFGKHNIYRTGSGVTDADNYYVVEIP